MDVSSYMKGNYEEFYAFERRKNKANSKPNKANLHRRRNLPKPSPKPAVLRLPPGAGQHRKRAI